MATRMIGNISAAKGEKAKGFIDVAKNADGTALTIPIIIINGKEEGPTLLVDGCCHGDEQEGTMMILNAVKKIDPRELRGTAIFVPALNTVGFHLRMRGNPFDFMYVDMNRIFPGQEDSFSITERAAFVYTNEIVSKADYVISFHGGGNDFYILPRVIVQEEIGPNRISIKESIQMGKAMATTDEWVIAGKSEHTLRMERTLLFDCALENKPAIIPEIGGGLRDPKTLEHVVKLGTEGILNVMRSIKMLREQPHYPNGWRKISEYKMLRTKHGGLLKYDQSHRPGDVVKQGTVLARIENLLGDEMEKIVMPFDGMILDHVCSTSRRPSELVAIVGPPPITIS